MIGEVVGRYRVTEALSEGGMGAVYVGVHELIGQKAAIKVLLPGLSNNKEVVRRFFNEAKATSQISHPGIVQIYDFGYHASGLAFIIMELLQGETLQDRLRRGVMSPELVADLGAQLADAIAAAHAAGIIHRDLKPPNLFLQPDPAATMGERVRVLDFGIAKLAEGNRVSERTMTGAVMGTPTYMSPEQCRGAGHVDLRTDIYSIGCILFEMLIGRPPFVREGVGELISDHLRTEPPHPRKMRADIPKPMAQLVVSMLAKDPEQRPPTMRHVAALLTDMQGSFAGSVRKSKKARAPSSSHHQTTLRGATGQAMAQQAPRSKAWLGILAGAVAGVAILFFTIRALSNDEGDTTGTDDNELAADEVQEPEAPVPNTSAGVSAAVPMPVAPEPTADVTEVRVSSTPVATAVVDGKDLGLTPVRIPITRGTPIDVVLTSDGHRKKTVTIDGATAELDVTLDAVPAQRVAHDTADEPDDSKRHAKRHRSKTSSGKTKPPAAKPKPPVAEPAAKPKPKRKPSDIVVD